MKLKKIKLLGLLLVILLTVGCIRKKGNQNKPNKQAKEETKTIIDDSTTNGGNESLAYMLNEKRTRFENTASEKKKQMYSECINSVRNSGILDRALNIGDKVPNFTLNNQLNEPIELYDELRKNPVILTWYRGNWCPYCNITLHYLQEKLPDFQKEGASLIALTPELPDKSLSTIEKHDLQFLVLSDLDNKVGKQFGIIFQLTPEVAASYQKSFNLHDYNGNDSDELPLAATYIIDQTGIIRYAFLDADYRNRAEPDELITIIKGLKEKY